MSAFVIYPTEEQEKIVKAFLEALNISFEQEGHDSEQLPQHVLDGIQRGLKDFEAGRYTTLDEFKKNLSISK